MIGVCKFCGCTDANSCRIPFTGDDGEILILGCSWLTDDVCTAPGCVEKAYLEARAIADDLIAIVGAKLQGEL